MSQTVFAQPQNVLDSTVERIAEAVEALAPSNVCVDISTALPANGWSNSAPYTQDWMNNKVTDECGVKVEFLGQASNTGVMYLEAEKIAGGVRFTAPVKPTVALPVIVHIINAEAESITDISADMVSTSAVSGAANVDEALTSLNSKFTPVQITPTPTNCTIENNACYKIDKLAVINLRIKASSNGIASGATFISSLPNVQSSAVTLALFTVCDIDNPTTLYALRISKTGEVIAQSNSIPANKEFIISIAYVIA